MTRILNVGHIRKTNKDIHFENEFNATVVYHDAKELIFHIDLVSGQIFVSAGEVDIFANGIDLDLLREFGVPMESFHHDFYNKGFSLDDENSYHYKFLTTNPFPNPNLLDFTIRETDDEYIYQYVKSSIMFVIRKSMPLNLLFVADDIPDETDCEFKEYLVSDEELKDKGVDPKKFKKDFGGFYMTTRNKQEKKII